MEVGYTTLRDSPFKKSLCLVVPHNPGGIELHNHGLRQWYRHNLAATLKGLNCLASVEVEGGRYGGRSTTLPDSPFKVKTLCVAAPTNPGGIELHNH